MGVVNVTPDSFSDGGQWYGAAAAIARGQVPVSYTHLTLPTTERV